MSTTATSRVPRMPVWLGDVIVAAFILLGAFAHFPGETGDKTVAGFVVTLLPALVLPFRRRWPWPALAVCLACYLVSLFTFPASPLQPFAVAVAVYAIAVSTDRARAWIASAVVLVPMIAGIVLAHALMLDPSIFQVLVTIGFAAAAGDGVRSRRAYIAEITARAVHAEQTRESEALRRVAEERLRIARDLHDAVAHQISVISLNAGVASSSLHDRPAVAEEALATIRAASRRVLTEIGELLALLRASSPDEPSSPPRSLAQLDALLEEFAASGLDVTLRREGDGPLPLGVDLVAYRVLQEALTNAHKHGSEHRAHVLIWQRDDELAITVTNPASSSPDRIAAASGHGLVGLSERVASVHGLVDAGPRGGAYRLDVRIPVVQGVGR